MEKQRAAIYVIYDKDGTVDGYKIYMLRELQKIAARLVVVCNGELSEEGNKKLSGLAQDIIIREDEGFDAWGHKIGLDFLGWENLSRYDEIIFLNDSIYGPFYPLKDMFDAMDKKNLDFWGVSKHAEIPDPYKLTRDGIFPKHISLYFYTVSKNMLTHSAFKAYWDNLPVLDTHAEVIAFHEVQVTRHFANLGFTWGVFADAENEFGCLNIAPIHLIPYELIKIYKVPVMKRKLFAAALHAVSGDNIKKAFDYIQDNTDYDTALIQENVLRTMTEFESSKNRTTIRKIKDIIPIPVKRFVKKLLFIK